MRMRAYEILSEKISLTHLQKPLTDAVYQSIGRSLPYVYNGIKKLSPEEKKSINDEGTMSRLIPIATNIFKFWLISDLEQSIPVAISNNSDVSPYGVSFKDMKNKGHADGMYVVLNKSWITEIIEDTVDTMYDYAVNNLQSQDETVDTFFKTFRDIKLDDIRYNSGNLDREIRDMVSTIIHEMVHIAQHAPQKKKGRQHTEYRSYLNKDKERFWKGVDKFETGNATDEDYRLYKSSPQEIAAFAQQAALQYMNDVDLDNIQSIDDVDNVLDSLKNEVEYYADKTFKNRENPQEYKVFKRFAKLMYQEIVRGLERKKQDLTKNTPE